MIRFWYTACAVFALLFAASNGIAAPATAPGVVSAGVLNVRAKPARHFERIGKFDRGDTVQVVSETDEWLEVILPPDAKAWVARQHLDAKGVVTANSLQVRSGPGVVFTPYAEVPQGTVLKLVGPPLDEWQQVLPPENATGWVSRAYVRMAEQIAAVAPAPRPEKPVVVAQAPAPVEATKPKPPVVEKPKPVQPPVVVAVEPPKPAAVVALPEVKPAEKPVRPPAKQPEPVEVASVEPKTTVIDQTATEYIRRVVQSETGVEVVIEARNASSRTIPEAKPAEKPVPVVEKPTPRPAEPPVVVAVEPPKPVQVMEKPVVVAVEPPKPAKVMEKPVVAAVEQPKPVQVMEKPVVAAVEQPKPVQVMEKPVVVAVEQPKPVEPPVVAVEKPVEIAALPKPIAKPVPKKIVEIVEAKPAEQPKPIEPPVVAVEQPAPKKTVDLVAPKLVELPAAKPVMAAVPAEAAPSLPPTTTPEIVLMAPVRAPDAPDVPRPATPKARYEAPIFVATAVAPAPAAQPEPAEPEIPAVTPEQPASADQQQVVPAVSANAATVPVASQLGAKPDRSWQEGVVFPLKDQAVPEASHILYRREGTVCYPICYLRSSRIDLSQWELREVRLYGDQVEVPGWSRPVIDVRGMQLKVAE